MRFTITAIAAAAALSAASAQAAVVSATGAGEIIPTPLNVINDSPASNTEIKAFDELQNVLLAADLDIDGGTIAAGTRVASHMVFLNRVPGSGRIDLEATFTFDREILGVIVSDADLDVSDAILGAAGNYDQFNNRGLESNDEFSFAGNVFTADFVVTEPGDWVRVITAPIPLPATAALLPLGFGALVAMRRRKKKADA